MAEIEVMVGMETMLKVAVLAYLFSATSVVSGTCFCKQPMLTEYKSELCCESSTSTSHQLDQKQRMLETRWRESRARGQLGTDFLPDSFYKITPWTDAIFPPSKQESSTEKSRAGLWRETFPSSLYESMPRGEAQEWKSQESDPVIVPRHVLRRRQALDERQKQGLEELLLFIQGLQMFRNSTGSRKPRHAQPAPICDPLRQYRTPDGSCNNAERPLRGAAGQGTTRLILPPAYQDEVFLPRFLDSAGRPLPSARHISLAVTSSRDVPLQHLTDSVWQWGQFIDHDLAMSPEVELDSPCCHRGRRAGDAHPFCLPITARRSDPVYGPCRKTCIEFVRSVPAWQDRQQVITQLNTRTSYIDADMIYGETERKMSSLRELQGGRLRVGPGKLLLPDPEPESRCFSTSEQEPCFRSGDSRVNEQVRLIVMHLVWMREHNRIANRLQQLNPHWEDERLFQESRRIVIAEIQHITYSHWLPIVLGNNYTDTNMMGEQTGTVSYSNRYNAETEPTIATEFSSAAFRFGHSLINNHIFLFSDRRRPPFGFTRLRDIFFKPHLIYQGATDFLAQSLVAQAPQKCDLEFASALTGHLFQESGSLCGLDLVAVNIQRGRDHGTPTYSAARRWCGLPRLASFAALTRVMSPEVVVRLAGVYRSVDDIDLYIGGVAERPVDGGLVGSTFQCLIGNQFFRLRWGDNFFYDLGGDQRPWRFSLAQIAELKRATWSKVLCDAIPTMTVVQPDAFRADTSGNRLTACSRLPNVSLQPWREHLDGEQLKSG